MFWRGVIGYLPANIVQGLVGFGALYLFTRLLSAEDYGLYAVAFATVSMIHTVLFTWIEAAMARFQVAERDRGAEPAHSATLYRLVWLLTGGLLLAAAGALAAFASAPKLELAIAIGLAAATPKCLMRVAQERARADGDVLRAVGLDMTFSVIGLIAGVALASRLGAGAPLAGAGIAAAVGVLWTWRGEARRRAGGRFEWDRARRYLSYGFPVSLANILAIALFSVDRMMIAALLGPAETGAYHAGYSVASRTLDVLFIWLGAASGPALVAALERGGPAALHEAARPQAELMVLLALPAAVGIALVAGPLAEVMVGPALREAAAMVTPGITLAALISGFCVYYTQQTFTLAKRTGMLLLVMAAPLTANVALNLLLIPRFGLMGAVWATVASFAFGAVTGWVLAGRTGRLPLPWTTAAKCALACGAMALAVLSLPAWGGLPELLLKASVGALVYGVCVLGLDAGGCRRLARTVVSRFGPAKPAIAAE
jgi:O-antigen/teichoic acid export membrane protein